MLQATCLYAFLGMLCARQEVVITQRCLYPSGAGAIMSLGLFRLISWDRVDGYFMRGSFASGGDSHLSA